MISLHRRSALQAQRKVAEPGPFLGDAESGEAWQSDVEHQREGLDVSRPLHLVEIMLEDVVELIVHLLFELDVLDNALRGFLIILNSGTTSEIEVSCVRLTWVFT